MLLLSALCHLKELCANTVHGTTIFCFTDNSAICWIPLSGSSMSPGLLMVYQIFILTKQQLFGGVNVNACTCWWWQKWWKDNGELPCKTCQTCNKTCHQTRSWKRTCKWPTEHLHVLKKTVEEHPEFHVDEFGTELHHPSTVWRKLHGILDCHLKVMTEVAL